MVVKVTHSETPQKLCGKRTSKDADNDSASAVIPRQMDRQQSSIETPNVSTNLSDIVKSCRQVNEL